MHLDILVRNKKKKKTKKEIKINKALCIMYVKIEKKKGAERERIKYVGR